MSSKQRRRGHGEGSIYRRESDGRWVGSVDLGYVDGKHKRKHVYGTGRKEVADKLKALLVQKDQGQLVYTERQTVGQFLEGWYAGVRDGYRPNTQVSYRRALDLYLLPTIGKVQLDKLTPQHVQALLVELGQGRKHTTVRLIHAVLRQALAQAEKWQLVPRNVATLVDLPTGEAFEATALTVVQAHRLLEAARGDRFEALYTVALSLGLRRGEALGLRWQDVDFEQGRLHIRKNLQYVRGKLYLDAPKTKKSVRSLPLPAVLADALKAQRAQQNQERLRAGGLWDNVLDLVFTTSRGKPLLPNDLYPLYKKLLERAGLPDMRFHDLRHSCASLLLAQRVDPRIIQEILGHSDSRMTAHYTHVYDESKQEAANAMDHLLSGTND